MQPQPPKKPEVSSMPVVPLARIEAPAQTSSRTFLLIVLGVLAANAAIAAVYFTTRPVEVTPVHVNQIDPRAEMEAERNHKLDKALAHMKELSLALTDYRDRLGGGMRWPVSLDELTQSGLLPQGFDFKGVLSGRPLSFQPDVPIGQNADSWVMVCDRVEEMRYFPGQRHESRVLVAAAVILGDGRAKILTEQDVGQYAGLNSDDDAPPARVK